MSSFARALMGGTAPQLQDLSIWSLSSDEGYDRGSFADMLEARASIPGCARFEHFGLSYHWFDGASLETQIRLLRVLLPSIVRLPDLSWKRGFVDCFCEARAPFLTELELSPDDGSDFSLKVVEAAPALINIECTDDCKGGTSILKPVSTALRHGALQNLKHSPLEQDVRVEVGGIWEFADALEHSVCATQLQSLRIRGCHLMEEMVRALAGSLSRGAFPALKSLAFSDDDIDDEGVVILAKALLNANQTCLDILDLSNVGMGDAGVAVLASVIQQGRFKNCLG